MYGNGGYMMLDFNNVTLSNNPVNIKGIYASIINANKPIYVLNCPAISDGVCTYVTSARSSTTKQIILSTFLSGRLLQILISPNDDVIYIGITISNVEQLNLESEASTNASKSDSNTDK